VVIVKDSDGRILGFLDRSPYSFLPSSSSLTRPRIAVVVVRGNFGNPEERERPLLETVTMGLINAQLI
jgi:hypothetical protein